MKTILVTGIGGLTPRSITGIIRENHPEYKIIGCDVEKKAIGFFMDGLVDEYYLAPRCDSLEYFPWIERLVAEKKIDYAFVQPESEIVEWGGYYEKYGKYPCPVFMGCRLLSESLRDKSIMADLLKDTDFIPRTIKVTQADPRYEEIEKEIGFPCWIRATEGTGGLGSLRLDDLSSYKSWLFINSAILLQKYTMTELSPTLTTCVYGFFGTELLGLAGIKIFDTKYQQIEGNVTENINDPEAVG